MLRYAVKRIALAVVILITVMLAMYAMVFLVPGDPASLALGPRATPELKALLRERMGLDEPVLWQVWHFFDCFSPSATSALASNSGSDT